MSDSKPKVSQFAGLSMLRQDERKKELSKAGPHTSAMQAYLKRYAADGADGPDGEKKKRKKKKVAAPDGGAIKIIDEDIHGQARSRKARMSDEEEDEENQPIIANEAEAILLAKQAEQAKDFYRRQQDGSGWANVTAERPSRHDSPDASPPRRGPTRHDSPDASPPRRGGQRDASPPRQAKARHDSPEASPPRRGAARHDSPDASPPRRGAASPDASPPRRGGQGDAAPPRRGAATQRDASPPRRGGQRDASPPRRGPARHDSPDASPPRRGAGRPADASPTRRPGGQQDASPPRRPGGGAAGAGPARPGARMADGTAAGLVSAAQLQQEAARLRAEADARRAAATGRNAETVYRDRTTGKTVTKDEFASARAAVGRDGKKIKTKEDEEAEQQHLEWKGGLAQRKQAEDMAARMVQEAAAPFARYADDAERDAILRARTRFGDPMAGASRGYAADEPKAVTSVYSADKLQKSGFNIPQGVPAHSWLKRGVAAPANRYDIRPGRHWDGVDRGTGFEKEMFKHQATVRHREREAREWAQSDM